MSQLTHIKRPIVRHLPSLNLVVRLEDTGIAIRAYRGRRWKSVTWAQLASLADDAQPILKVCECRDGLQVLKAMGATVAKESKRDE